MLTDVQVKALTPGPKVRRLWDGQDLYLEARPTGSRQWVLKYSFDGKERRAGLGPYPEVGLKAAPREAGSVSRADPQRH